MTKRLYIITGQTATGKTKLALEYASQYNGELINCDSRQIYRHLDIVTGKDLSDNKFTLTDKIGDFNIGFYNLQPSKIWLYDIVDPKANFSSFDYQTCALFVLQKILKAGKTPIFVGGTYFYLKHLLYDIASEQIPPDWELRKSLEKKTVVELQAELKKINLNLYEKLNDSDKKNRHRLIRKIEISLHPNRPQTDDQPQSIKEKLSRLLDEPSLEINLIGLKCQSREEHRQLIEKRVTQRIKQGAIDEVKKLLEKGYTDKDPGLKTIGYQQIFAYLNNNVSKEEMIDQWITKEMQYAKRQLTFMKKNSSIKWKESPCKLSTKME